MVKDHGHSIFLYRSLRASWFFSEIRPEEGRWWQQLSFCMVLKVS